jgi:hypothetical protein
MDSQQTPEGGQPLAVEAVGAEGASQASPEHESVDQAQLDEINQLDAAAMSVRATQAREEQEAMRGQIAVEEAPHQATVLRLQVERAAAEPARLAMAADCADWMERATRAGWGIMPTHQAALLVAGNPLPEADPVEATAMRAAAPTPVRPRPDVMLVPDSSDSSDATPIRPRGRGTPGHIMTTPPKTARPAMRAGEGLERPGVERPAPASECRPWDPKGERRKGGGEGDLWI